MKTTDASRASDRGSADGTDPAMHTIRVPTFLLSHGVGLGEMLKRISTSLGAPPCARCDERAARLNRWLRFAPSERPGRDLG
jgi:hypothetical protein